MKLFLIAGVLPGFLFAQYCASTGALPPSGTTPGNLDAASCQLTDGTPYTQYHLVLPVRGRLQLEVTAPERELAVHLRDGTGTGIERGKSINRAMEAGTYSVVVSANGAGQTGSFSLRSSFTVETNAFCTGFPSLGPNQKVTGKVGTSGCNTPAGAPYEAYTIHSFGIGTIDFTVASEEIAPSLILRDEDGYSLTTGDTSLSYQMRPDRNYTLVVMGGGKTGAYELTSSYRAEDSDRCRPQASFTGSDQKAGAISAQSCSFTVNQYGDQLYFDLFEITLADGGTAELNATSQVFSPVIYLFDAAGNRIASEAFSGGRNTSLLRVWLRAGTYTALVASAQAVGGSYSLEYTVQLGAAKTCPVQTLSTAQEMAGTLSPSSCRTSLGLSDVYKVTLPASGTLEVAMLSDTFDTVLAVRDEKDDVIVTNDDYQGLSNSYLPVDLPAGTYTVVAGSNGGGGAYAIASRFTAHEIAPCARLEKLQANTGLVRTLGITPCRAANGEPVDYYEFTLNSPGTVAAVATSQLIDVYLTLTDPDGKVLRADDNSYGGGDALLVEYLSAGTYRLAVRASQTSSIGAYELDFLYREGERSTGCAPKATIEAGNTITGNINFTGCQLATDFGDVYQFTVAETGAVEVRVESKDFDAFGMVLDSKGNVVTADDDSGGNANARLAETLDPGTYYLVARPVSAYPFDSGGAYTVSLSSVPAAAASAAANTTRIDKNRNHDIQHIDPFNGLVRVGKPRIHNRSQRQKQKTQ